ncbi:tRNA pseudouridine(55) synthase TruB [Aquibacillus halophilus]|uniref:tRNA pseudouridine synthase B n=1 Tax=Aquibacillus halophilus TaxID=930132 RepID=A0A6A8D961_9BACI|nr:tRNA pseudouridine(55) synthase TruB [Aquibacillus halophilus]MRH42305.1 tRNA pseudouridine(55) synthase TruB [Aquibacillus halophilus]
MNGILPLWKPRGLTSHDCVVKIRRLLKTKKVGHTGTLDPEVEGVLPICIGQATKIVPFLTDTKKTYIAEVTLGISTETEDSYGEVIEKKEVLETIDSATILSVLKQFIGDIKQVPPMYSAVKINGKKLYEYAREGKIVERPSRVVTIHNIEPLTEIKKHDNSTQSFTFQVECSKGTYIRTLCVDIGKIFGYPAHMSKLTRTETGSFNMEDSYSFEQIENAVAEGTAEKLLAPIQRGVKHLDVYYVTPTLATNIIYGQKLPIPKNLPETDPFRVQLDEKLLAIYQLHPTEQHLIKPVRVFETILK